MQALAEETRAVTGGNERFLFGRVERGVGLDGLAPVFFPDDELGGELGGQVVNRHRTRIGRGRRSTDRGDRRASRRAVATARSSSGSRSRDRQAGARVLRAQAWPEKRHPPGRTKDRRTLVGPDIHPPTELAPVASGASELLRPRSLAGESDWPRVPLRNSTILQRGALEVLLRVGRHPKSHRGRQQINLIRHAH